jgi:(p)ppGpp synthase/HD superfamily hydrolase
MSKQMIAAAITFAVEKHGDQMYGEKPYSYHLLQVLDKVQEQPLETRLTAILHDVLEDTDATRDELCGMFGHVVARNVWVLTKTPGLEYKAYINCIRHNPIALEVKIADTLCNLTQSHKEGNLKRIRKYSKQMYLLTKE